KFLRALRPRAASGGLNSGHSAASAQPTSPESSRGLWGNVDSGALAARGSRNDECGGEVSRVEIRILAGLTVLTVAILALAGRFAPTAIADTPLYLRIVGFPDMLAEPRSPLYGWLVAALDLGGSSHRAVPAFQIAAYLAAVWLLVARLRRYGLSAAAGLGVRPPPLVPHALPVHPRLVHP